MMCDEARSSRIGQAARSRGNAGRVRSPCALHMTFSSCGHPQAKPAERLWSDNLVCQGPTSDQARYNAVPLRLSGCEFLTGLMHADPDAQRNQEDAKHYGVYTEQPEYAENSYAWKDQQKDRERD